MQEEFRNGCEVREEVRRSAVVLQRKMTHLTKTNAWDAWIAALANIKESGVMYSDTKSREYLEVRNLIVTIERTNQGIFEPILYLSRSDKWVYPDLAEVAKVILHPDSVSAYEYSYAKRLFATIDGKNQIDDYVIPLLQKDPQTRRAVATLFDPGVDSNIKNKEIPSMIVFDFKIRDQLLHMTCFIRSSDAFIGWPANVYQMSVIQEYVASKLKIPVGEITTIATSAHIHTDHLPEIDKLLKKN